VALWSPRLPGWALAQDVLHGTAEAPAAPHGRPAPALLAPTERRRAPDTVAIALEVAMKACEAAGRAPRELASVFASRYGDLPICDYMCSTLASTPALCSPTKFHNSVHNAASGYWTIGTGSHAPSTALLAGENTFAAGLLEAIVQALADRTAVLLVAYDVEARGALVEMMKSEGLLGLALVLDPDPAARGLQLAATVRAGECQPNPPLPERWGGLLPHSAMLPGAGLLAAIAAGRATTLSWPLGAATHLEVSVQHAGESPE
jgi:hypothetical protein